MQALGMFLCSSLLWRWLRGRSYFLALAGNVRNWALFALAVLLPRQGFETVRAQSNFISYSTNWPGKIQAESCFPVATLIAVSTFLVCP